VRLIRILLVLAFIFASNFCKDIVFNNPLDPDFSKEDLKIIKEIRTSLSGAGDICYDGEKLWKVDKYGRVTAIDILSGLSIREITGYSGTGIAYLNGSIFISSGDNYLVSLDALSGEFEENILTKEIYFSYIASMNGFLVGFDSRSSEFLEFDPETGNVRVLFKLSGFTIGGISEFNNLILVTEKITNSVYLFDTRGNISDIYNSPIGNIEGITVDENLYIYLFSLNGEIYKVSIP